jgi:hypothetical protein
MTQKRGEYLIIRVDGSEEVVTGKPTLEKVYAAIGCECIDTVLLDRASETLMMVDDTGMIDGRPINAKATKLYHSVCRPGTVHSIHGDVAIVNDGDFA